MAAASSTEEEHEMTTPAENKEIVTRSFAATIPVLRIDVLKNLYAPKVIDHSPLLGQSAYDLDVLQQTAAAFLAGFPDFAIELEHVMADGDKVSYFETVSGTHTGDFLGLAPTGKTMEAHASHIVRIADGRIVEHWAVRDYRGLTEFLPGPPPD
jgi:predicted ester cyclase